MAFASKLNDKKLKLLLIVYKSFNQNIDESKKSPFLNLDLNLNIESEDSPL